MITINNLEEFEAFELLSATLDALEAQDLSEFVFDDPDETWLDVPGFDDYLVSSKGRVQSLGRYVTTSKGQRYYQGKMLAATPNHDGYPRVSIRGKDGVVRSVYVHDMVAAAFIGEKPQGMEVRHLDDVKDNNTEANIAYGTRSENRLDAVTNGIHPWAKRTHCKNGHEFTAENTTFYAARPRTRLCITCARDRRAKYVLNKAVSA